MGKREKQPARDRDDNSAPGDRVAESTGTLVGIDVGGTFTDFVWLIDGRLKIYKQPTTPADQSRAIIDGLASLGVGEDTGVVHGTTVATNALLEHRGAKTALLTTRGFRDVLAIGRQNRPHLYRLGQHRPPALVPAHLRYEADERVGADGGVVQPLSEDEIRRIALQLQRQGVESIAIVLLFSFLHPDHEQRAARILREVCSDIYLSVSHELLPEYREYERTATTVVNAYVQPLVARYLDRLQRSLGRRPVRVMQSSGGAIGLQQAAQQAGRLVLSGPAGGIVGAFEVARRAGETDSPHLITFDMGGTSTDVALCPGVLPQTSEGEIAGLPLRFPSTDIHTVGAGGGSIARVDAGGILRVGPESAGARPGPACYGRGGTEPTVTDANLVLGRFGAGGVLGGAGGLHLQAGQSHAAIASVADALSMSVEGAALGIVRVANAVMERALRRVSVERGHDPRDYMLVPFGGAGPLHACELAEALDIRHILVPRYPGVLSALGLLMADVKIDGSVSLLQDSNTVMANPALLASRLASLQQQVRDELAGQGEASPVFEARLDMRYSGQSYELEVELALPVSEAHIAAAVQAFHRQHERRYGYARAGAGENVGVEIVTVRVIGHLQGAAIAPQVETPAHISVDQAIISQAAVWFDASGPVEVPCYDRSLLQQTHRFSGPCVILQYDTTLVVTARWTVGVDAQNNINLWRTEYAP